MSRKIRLTGYLDVPEERLASVIARLPIHLERTRLESGCLEFDVSQSTTGEGRLLVSELFEDQAVFEAYQKRIAALSWAEITAGIRRHYEITEE
jgi:quinol monooxygenase YgiN